MMFEDYRVTSDLGGTRMTRWLPNAHTTATRLQMTARRALSRWELYRRRRAELERVMAIRIQNLYRARKARLHMAVMRAMRDLQDQKEFAAASMLQKIFRARIEQRRYRKKIALKRAADRDQLAADTLQRTWRRYWARKRLYLIRAEISCRLFQRVWRGLMGRERLSVRRELKIYEHKWIAPAFTRLEQLRCRLVEATARNVGKVVEALVVATERKMIVEGDVDAVEGKEVEEVEVEEEEEEKEKEGEKGKERGEESGEDVGDEEDEDDADADDSTNEEETLRRAINASIADVREMVRYFRLRGRLQPATALRSPKVLFAKLSDYEDRQICARMVLDDDTNALHSRDAMGAASVAELERQISEVEAFVKHWRAAATDNLMRHRFSCRWLRREEIYTKTRETAWKEEYPNVRPSAMPVPSSVAQREWDSGKTLGALQHAHLRAYTTSSIKHDLYMLRRFFLSRRRLRDKQHQEKLEFARTSVSSWLGEASIRAETVICEANAEHDKAILAVEEPWICAEDKRATQMRHYLTATSFARIALWEEFVSLFDNKSRVQLFHAKERMEAKEKELAAVLESGQKIQGGKKGDKKGGKKGKQRDKNQKKKGGGGGGKSKAGGDPHEFVLPSDADAEVIAEHTTIDAKEFQEFTRRAGHPIMSAAKLDSVLAYVDPNGTGRVQFERAAYWYFSGTGFEVARQKSFVKHNAVMASMLVKRKQDMANRWIALKWSRVPFIANRRAKREKRESARKYTEERKVMEEEKARKLLEESILKEKEDAIALEEKEYLDKVTYLNGLGDSMWRLAKSDPPFEKHFRPPAWSAALSQAMLNAGILPDQRAAFGVRKIAADDDDDVYDEEKEEGEKEAEAEAEDLTDSNKAAEEEKNADEEKKAEAGATQDGDKDSKDGADVQRGTEKEKQVGNRGEEGDRGKRSGDDDDFARKDEKMFKMLRRKTRKPQIASRPYEGRTRAPGNDMRASYMLGQGIDEGDLMVRSKAYRKELRKRKKKREQADAKARAKAERWAAMSPEKRIQEQMKEAKAKAKKTPQAKAAAAKAKKAAEEKKRLEKKKKRQAKQGRR
jgi:hypothetical protein